MYLFRPLARVLEAARRAASCSAQSASAPLASSFLGEDDAERAGGGAAGGREPEKTVQISKTQASAIRELLVGQQLPRDGGALTDEQLEELSADVMAKVPQRTAPGVQLLRRWLANHVSKPAAKARINGTQRKLLQSVAVGVPYNQVMACFKALLPPAPLKVHVVRQVGGADDALVDLSARCVKQEGKRGGEVGSHVLEGRGGWRWGGGDGGGRRCDARTAGAQSSASDRSGGAVVAGAGSGRASLHPRRRWPPARLLRW